MTMNFKLTLCSALAIALAGCGSGDDDPSAAMHVLSSEPSMATGADTLIAVDVPQGSAISDVKLTLNGKDVSTQLSLDAATNTLRGLVTGLVTGSNTFETTVAGGRSTTLAVTSYPVGGPVFSGPQAQPWVCTTAMDGVGAALDAQCNVAPKFDYFYMSKASGAFVAYNPASPPAASDIATTTTDLGVTMNYIVRRESGSIDRAAYQIAVLFDPSKPWTAMSPQAGWNKKVYIPLQGGFGHAYSQGHVRSDTPQEAILNDMALKRGFIVTKTTFLQAVANMDWVRGAESLMMLKERIAKQYGTIRYTFSSGASGGSMVQNLVANSYPGLLQGIIPMAEFVDFWGESSHETPDCIQLKSYFTTTSASLWANPAQRIAVNGHLDETTCNFYSTTFTPFMNPSLSYTAATSPEVPASIMYDPVANPRGARGTQQDYQVNYFGRRPQSLWTAPEVAAGFGFALSPYDNVGVQYGLKALADGKISAEQFVDLNEKIGGLSVDFKPIAARHQQDPGAAALLYRAGFINDASQMNKLAILSVRLPDVDPIASHSMVHSFILRDRLIKAHGNDANHALWIIPRYSAQQPHELSFVAMDRWLTAVEADKSSRPMSEKVVSNKPADIVNGCWDPASTSITLGNQVADLDQCTTKWYPVSATPRIVAASNNRAESFVSKCQLKPLVRTDYSTAFTDPQWSRLQAVFTAGVCDYTKPDAAQTTSVPWLSFANGPGGTALTLDSVPK